MKTIKGIFEMKEDWDIAGVSFECEGKIIRWKDFSRSEQIRILNAWFRIIELLYKFLKEE